jgi:hypothetical protein
MALSDLPTLGDQGRCAKQKWAITTQKRLKGRKDRAEARIKKQVRADVDTRDGYCLVQTRAGILGECKGRSTWAHFAGHRRSQTRGMAPERRHDTRFSGKLCERHHALEESGKCAVIYKTADYADGEVGWEVKRSKVAA